MELTRRDALVAAAGGGVGLSGGALLAAARSDLGESGSASNRAREPASGAAGEGSGVLPETFVAVARAIYPSAVSEVETFVRTYVEDRFAGSGDRRDDVTETVRDLDGLAKGWHGASIAGLDPETVGEVLSEIGVDGAEADPAGTVSQRVRYHVVNELQYALYTSPTGGKLAGIENPIGYPGGIESYRRGPSA